MSCGGCGRVIAVQVPLFGGGSDAAWNVRPKGDTYTVTQGSGNAQDPAQNALRYLKQQADPFHIRGCKSWLLTAVQVAPSSTDMVSAHVARYLAVGGLGDSTGGWGTFGPLGSVGGALADAGVGAVTGTISGGVFDNTTGVINATPSAITGTIGVDAVDLDTANITYTGNMEQVDDFDVALDMAATFRNVVALPAICCPNFPLPVDSGWTLALRLAADAGLGAILGRDVVLTLAGKMPCGCACSQPTGETPA